VARVTARADGVSRRGIRDREHGISSPTLRPSLTLLDYFDADVSGRDFATAKPDPETFLTAAHELGVEPRHAIVIEDASAGVQAAEAGGMANPSHGSVHSCTAAPSTLARPRNFRTNAPSLARA